jgi:outer membrane protein TolC
MSATIIQPVLSLYGIYNLHNASLKMKKAAEYDTIKIQRELQRDIAKVYFGMLSAIENEKSIDAAIDQIEKTYPVVQALIDEGQVEPNALLKLKLQKSDFEKAKMSISIAIQNSKLILNMILNRDLDSPLQPVWNDKYYKTVKEKITAEDNSKDTVTFLNKIPEIKSMEEKLSALKSNKHAAISSFLPELNLVLNYDLQEGFGDMQPQNQLYAGILFSWNVWEWGNGFYKIKVAETQTAKTQINLALLKSGKILEIKQLENSLKKALAEIKNGEIQVKYAKESLRIEEELFKAGTSTTTELLQAQTFSVKAENDLNIKKAELCSFYIEFILSTGHDFIP